MHYGETQEKDYKSLMLQTAFALFLVDWILIAFLFQGLIKKPAFFLVILFLSFTPSAKAAEPLTDSEYADGFYLAYIETGDPAVDRQTQNGLENLARILDSRTSAEPSGVAAVDPEQDQDLAFFPFLYWSVSTNAQNPSPDAFKRIQDYLDRGGTIVFDTRDGAQENSGFGLSSNSQALQKILKSLNVPALQVLPEDHVLLRSFYLLDKTPGHFSEGRIWIELASAPGRDGVSSIIIGSQDWAGLWSQGLPATRAQEMSYRFGINLVVYALTGNYKADQIHVSEILKRLGR